jgi:hypothetical protein
MQLYLCIDTCITDLYIDLYIDLFVYLYLERMLSLDTVCRCAHANTRKVISVSIPVVSVLRDQSCLFLELYVYVWSHVCVCVKTS